ncbi:PREDICTED: probable FBD-associated F-box protein At1g32375 [Camelina sativa]|uniref:Probable FBD-associated F-box protein At1g32375 n=1 Tax=Camelina sativa TaxID=90675 RepID=A0ABM0UMF3_CAMSA|nr:PREDICTED: probable FBD-associated F-box protein At1g32375 [Camelina sativa]XP_019087726.1 PREDICTED: probable FBD-associated F-box protein At1g32375 [Camelina sativa]
MDRISQLPDELLLRILSLLPSAKDVVATMVLSKRWQFLWMFVPRLVYDDDSYQGIIDYGRFSRFVDRSLIFHKAPVLETLHFKLGKICGAGDIHVWIRAADKCSVRELIIEIHTSSSVTQAPLPRSLYTGCSMLVKLKLDNAVLVDVIFSSVSFPSLKTLSLLAVEYPGDDFVKRLLSGCPVLEDLDVVQCPDDNVTIFTVKVPSLKTLSLRTVNKVEDDAQGFVIDAPSLEWLKLVDYTGGFCVIENNMPNIEEAYIDVEYHLPRKILTSIVSVQHLDLCLLTSKDAYPLGSIFRCLIHLKICTCDTEWLNLLMRVLNDSPKLRALKLEQYHPLRADEPRPCWSEPNRVPMLSSLKTLEWVKYEGTKEEKEVAAFILRRGRFLDKVTIKPKSTCHREKLEMIKELSLLPRSSSTCSLSFD